MPDFGLINIQVLYEKIVVTGATGHLGRKIFDHLSENDDLDVWGLIFALASTLKLSKVILHSTILPGVMYLVTVTV